MAFKSTTGHLNFSLHKNHAFLLNISSSCLTGNIIKLENGEKIIMYTIKIYASTAINMCRTIID